MKRKSRDCSKKKMDQTQDNAEKIIKGHAEDLEVVNQSKNKELKNTENILIFIL